MAFRGWMTLDGMELVNSSRTAARMRPSTPVTDAILTGDTRCADSCGMTLTYDDSWPGLGDFLGDDPYTPESAPWYDAGIPQSRDFMGVLLLKIDGLASVPVSRGITELVGDGAVAAPHRDTSRKVTFTALLVACSNAGVAYGLDWLSCQLRRSTAGMDSVLAYLHAHPGGSQADPDRLRRELRGVVLTTAPTVSGEFQPGSAQHRQGNLWSVTWDMVALSPYAYLPAVDIPVSWDSETVQSIQWVHATDCSRPSDNPDIPVLFSTECVPEDFQHAVADVPVCGGCVPLGEITRRTFTLPAIPDPSRCLPAAVSMTVLNTGGSPLTLQGHWETQGTNRAADANLFPFQVSGLVSSAELVLDGATGRYHANHNGRRHVTRGIVGTPRGAPWRPPLVDRSRDYILVVESSSAAEFQITLSVAEREV